MLNKKIVKYKMYTNSMKLKLAFALMFILIVLPMLSSQYVVGSTQQSLGTFKQGQVVNLSMSCTNATQGIIEYVVLPNSNQDILNSIMNRNGNLFTYGYTNTYDLGHYIYYGNCNGVPWNTDFYITYSGRSNPDGVTIVFFSAAFIFLIVFGTYQVITSLKKTILLDMTLEDALYMISFYIGLWAFYYISSQYMGDLTIINLLDLSVNVSFYTHFLMPLICFLTNYIMINLQSKKRSNITY